LNNEFPIKGTACLRRQAAITALTPLYEFTNTAQLNKDWGCLEFNESVVDRDPKTLMGKDALAGITLDTILAAVLPTFCKAVIPCFNHTGRCKYVACFKEMAYSIKCI
jgi:hypothetical protein